jgi:hypothetical protein
MKKTFYILGLLLISLLLSDNLTSATLKLVKYDSLSSGAIDDVILRGHAQLQNTSGSTVEINTDIKIVKRATGHTFSVCDPVGCGPVDSIDSRREEPFPLEGGASSGNFLVIDLFLNDQPGTTILNIKYSLKNNPADFVTFNIIFSALVTSIEEVTDNSSIMSMACPSIADGFINLKLNQSINDANISIFDLYGNKVKSEVLNGDNLNLATADLSQGSYYYIISRNGIIISRNNFIIAR